MKGDVQEACVNVEISVYIWKREKLCTVVEVAKVQNLHNVPFPSSHSLVGASPFSGTNFHFWN